MTTAKASLSMEPMSSKSLAKVKFASFCFFGVEKPYVDDYKLRLWESLEFLSTVDTTLSKIEMTFQSRLFTAEQLSN